MANFCSKCGAQLNDGTAFCANCGTPVVQQTQGGVEQYAAPQPVAEQPAQQYVAPQQPVQEQYAQQPAPQVQKSKSLDFKKPLFSIGNFKIDLMKLLIAGGALVLVVVLLIVLLGSSGSPKSVAEKAVGAYFDDFDADAIIDLVHEDVISVIADDEEMTEKELRRECQEEINEFRLYIEREYDDYSIDWEVIDVRDASFSDLEEAQEDYLDYSYNLHVTDMKIAKVHLEVEYVEDGELDRESDTEEIELVKIDGDWYIDFDEFF